MGDGTYIFDKHKIEEAGEKRIGLEIYRIDKDVVLIIGS